MRHAEGDRPGILYYLGRLDLNEHNYKKAVDNLSKANSHSPFPDAPFYLGLAYLKLCSDQEAEKSLKKAIELNPGESRAEYELASLYRKQGREEDAKHMRGARQRAEALVEIARKNGSQRRYFVGLEGGLEVLHESASPFPTRPPSDLAEGSRGRVLLERVPAMK